MEDSPDVVAQVLLRSTDGARPGVDVPISAASLDRLRPSPSAVEAVVDHLGRAGFVILHRPDQHGLTIGFSGPKALFETHFGIELTLDANHAYEVRRPRSGRTAGTTHRPTDPTDVPLTRLPATVRAMVAAVALETARSTDERHFDA